jgi:hypothetical protein
MPRLTWLSKTSREVKVKENQNQIAHQVANFGIDSLK